MRHARQALNAGGRLLRPEVSGCPEAKTDLVRPGLSHSPAVSPRLHLPEPWSPICKWNLVVVPTSQAVAGLGGRAPPGTAEPSMRRVAVPGATASVPAGGTQ